MQAVLNNSTNQTTLLTYDNEDRISSIQVPGVATTNQYAYNALDSRVGKVDSGGTATYLRDGEGATDDVLNDGSATYVPGISRHTSAGTRTYHQNFAGSNSAETDSTGTTQATRTHDAFGNLVATTGTPSGPFGYVGGGGYQEDNDSGLRLLGHRYYDASVGRFITRDPAQDGGNWYAYCGNSPTNGADPTGFGATAGSRTPILQGPASEVGGQDPWDGGYWSGEGRIWGGIGKAFKDLPGGMLAAAKKWGEGGLGPIPSSALKWPPRLLAPRGQTSRPPTTVTAMLSGDWTAKS